MDETGNCWFTLFLMLADLLTFVPCPSGVALVKLRLQSLSLVHTRTYTHLLQSELVTHLVVIILDLVIGFLAHYYKEGNGILIYTSENYCIESLH